MRRLLVLIGAGLSMAAMPAGAIALGALFVPHADRKPAGDARDVTDQRWHQVRIEQHVIIRISPRDPGLAPPPPQPPPPERLRERRTLACVTVAAIGGVQPLTGNRLILFMRNQALVGVDLPRMCRARDFYLGFYIAPTDDGMVCVERDTIHARSGATCAISALHELVPSP